MLNQSECEDPWMTSGVKKSCLNFFPAVLTKVEICGLRLSMNPDRQETSIFQGIHMREAREEVERYLGKALLNDQNVSIVKAVGTEVISLSISTHVIDHESWQVLHFLIELDFSMWGDACHLPQEGKEGFEQL